MMKSFFKKLAFVMALAMVVSLAAPAATTAAAAEALQIKYQNGVDAPSEINLAKVGAMEDLKFTGAPDYKEAGFEWTSSNPAVATVNQKGEVTAVAAGTAEVTITVGDRQDTVKVNVVDLPTYTATMGINSKDLKTEITLEVGGEVDFGFFGIKDYDRNRYQCNWFEAGDGSVATVDKNGVIKAVGAGTTVISLGVYNVITGQKHSVASCTVTVGAKATPTPAVSVTAKQTTEKNMILTFTGVDVEKLKKENIEVYEYYLGEDGNIEHEYVWQIQSIDTDEDDENILYVNGYATQEFTDESNYIVRYVKNDEVVVFDTFVASVGAVKRVESYYGSYWNNQGEIAFPGEAYTNAGSGEEIDVVIGYRLYDDEDIDVTGHYLRENDNQDLVTIELITEDADSYFELNEDNNTLIFDDIPESPVVQFNVVYEDYNDGEPVSDDLTMVVKEAIPYEIKSIDDWAITIVDTQAGDDFSSKKYAKKDVALYDDYDLVSGDPLENHEIVLWFTDNYGNKYVTDARFAGWKLEYIEASEKFFGEGYEIHFESRNPQVLVVGDEYDDDSNSSTITTKKVGTATVNVTLYNSFEDELVDRMGTLSIAVKAERYVKSVSANNITVATDSLPYNDDAFVTGALDDNNNDGNDGKYDPRFTTGWVNIVPKDQYGDVWGKYNVSAHDSITISAEATNVDNTSLDLEHDDLGWDPNWASEYSYKFDGAQMFDLADEKLSSVSYKVTVEDFLNEDVKTTTFRVSLKYPTLDENEEADTFENIVTKDRLTLAASDLNFTDRKMTISVQEFSKNNIAVNYADFIELITDQDEYKDVFNKGTDKKASVGSYFIVVLDPKGKVVTAGDVDNLGVEEHESGLYTFWAADIEDSTKVTKFATAGSYTVKLLEVTAVNADGSIKTTSVTTSKFRLTDNRIKMSFVNQEEIYYDSDDLDKTADTLEVSEINAIGTTAFKYDYKLNNDPVEKVSTAVRFKKNTKANTVVIQDVFFRVFFYDSNGNYKLDQADAYYYVEVPVDKTVSLEDVDVISDTSVEYRHDPEGNLIKK